MRRIMLFLMVSICTALITSAQSTDYVFIEAQVKSPSSVIITLKTFCEKKRTVDLEAKRAALRIIMFDGLDGTIYNKPLLNQGTMALYENEEYFDNLFNNRISDVVRSATMKSDFKKAEKGEKSTLFMVEVNYIQLKKDLEKNKIKKQLGV